MHGPIDLLLLLKFWSHNTKLLAQVHAHAITSGITHSTLTWNCLIRAYSNTKYPIQAILIYNHLIQATPLFPSKHTFPPLLKACSSLPSPRKGKETHAHITKTGFLFDIYIQNSLIHFYGYLTQINNARQVFDEMPVRDLVSWNTILSAYVISPHLRYGALILFQEMVDKGIGADNITMVILLSACAQLGERGYGRIIHHYMIAHEIRCSLNLANSLLSMYIASNAMDTALRVFQAMGEKDMVSYSIMINGYVKLGLVDVAREIFNKMPFRDLVSWNSMIRGYLKCKCSEEALELFREMWAEKVQFDEFAVVSVLSACADLSDLQFGRWVHLLIERIDIKFDIFVETALIDMYSKCGSLEDAIRVFDQMEFRDVFAWTTMIGGFANYGRGKEALGLFSKMQKAGTEPNEATFVAVLTACSHSGLADEGLLWFNKMSEIYKILPRVEHFGCMIDLLCRAGLLKQAEELTRTIPTECRIIAYKTLIGACIVYDDFELGERVANEIMKLDHCDYGVYILLSNLYASAGRWEHVEDTRRLMHCLDLRKEVGFSSVEVETLENTEESKLHWNFMEACDFNFCNHKPVDSVRCVQQCSNGNDLSF